MGREQYVLELLMSDLFVMFFWMSGLSMCLHVWVFVCLWFAFCKRSDMKRKGKMQTGKLKACVIKVWVIMPTSNGSLYYNSYQQVKLLVLLCNRLINIDWHFTAPSSCSFSVFGPQFLTLCSCLCRQGVSPLDAQTPIMLPVLHPHLSFITSQAHHSLEQRCYSNDVQGAAQLRLITDIRYPPTILCTGLCIADPVQVC